MGAISKVTPEFRESPLRQEVFDVLRRDEAVTITVSVFNDTHSHTEVLAMFDRCIAALEKM